MKLLYACYRIALVAIIINITVAKTSNAQVSRNYLYGKVLTKDSTVFEGYIQIGKRSFLWGDFFYLNKLDNPYSEFIPESKRNIVNHRVSGENGSVRIINRNLNSLSVHELTIRFGYLTSIEFLNNRYIRLGVKNDNYINVRSSYSHRDLDIVIINEELGKVKMNASQISEIQFFKAPKYNDSIIPKPLFGKVVTKKGDFSGFVWWDNDECNDESILNGMFDSKDVSVYFKNIKSIVSNYDSSDITTLLGTRVTLSGSNDVNYENRGIFVNMPNVGKVKINWNDFISVEFNRDLEHVGLSYDDYKEAERLKGSILTKENERVEGVIVYDLDEAMNVECLNGNNGKMEYTIPLMYVKKIIPKGYKYSEIELKNGAKLFLGNSSDVDYKNDGVLIFEKENNYKYFYWYEIKEISFE